MPPAGFEISIPASERPQTHALDRNAAGINLVLLIEKIPNSKKKVGYLMFETV